MATRGKSGPKRPRTKRARKKPAAELGEWGQASAELGWWLGAQGLAIAAQRVLGLMVKGPALMPEVVDKGGRPTVFTEETQRVICESLKQNPVLKDACAMAGIHYDTFRRWAKMGQDDYATGNVTSPYFAFYVSVQKALAEFKQQRMNVITQAAAGRYRIVRDAKGAPIMEIDPATGQPRPKRELVKDGSWQAAAWQLERRFPEEYGMNHVIRQPAPGGMDAIEALDTSALTDDELREFLRLLNKCPAIHPEQLKATGRG